MKDELKEVRCITQGCNNSFMVPVNSRRTLCPVCRAAINKDNRARARKGGKRKPA